VTGAGSDGPAIAATATYLKKAMGELYRADLVMWAAQQAEALRSAARAGNNAPVDWDNVAEEIESLGVSERRTLASHLRTVIEHLIKLRASPAAGPRNGWMDTIDRVRVEIEDVLRDSPSLRREVPDMIARETIRARRFVARDLDRRGEPAAALNGMEFDADQVLGPWMPD
jgi:hypothetical protein